jgi:PAS domain S-box-containing protein
MEGKKVARVLTVVHDITESKKAEQALKDSEEQYRLLSSVAFNYVYSTQLEDDGKLHLNRVAGAFEEITGYSFEEYVEHGGWRSLLHPDDLALDDHDMEMLQSNRNVTTELRTIHKSGRVQWVRVYAYPVWDEQQNRLVGVSGAVQDITDRKQAEDSLRESQMRFNAAFTNSPIVLVVSSVADNKYVNVNDHFTQVTGFSREDAIGRTAAELKIFVDQNERDQLVSDVRKDGHVYGREIRFRVKSGKIITCLISMSIIQVNGKPHFLTSAVDITERRRAEEVLRENEQRLSSIYNTVGDVIFHLAVESEDQYRFASVNPAFFKVTGLSPESVIGKRVNDVIPEPSLNIVLEKYRQVIEAKTVVRWEEISDYPTWQLIGEVSVVPVFDAQGRCTHLVGSVHDITERKRAEEARVERERRYRALFDLSPAGILLLDSTGRILEANDAFCKTYG